MVHQVLAKACRLCASIDSSVEMHKITGTIHNIPIIEWIQKCIQIEISENDVCRNVCENCMTRLVSQPQPHEYFKKGQLDFSVLLKCFEVNLMLTDCLLEPDILRSPNITVKDEKFDEEIGHLQLREPQSVESVNEDRTIGKSRNQESKTNVEETRFQCEFCSLRTKYFSKLKTHLKTHTGEKPYKCEICEYKCALSSTLTSHMRIHTGEKPFKCEICSFKCTHNAALVIHLRTHTGEKPFKCDVCSYKSTNNTSLIVHSRTHTGEKPYKCEICSFKSTHNASLKIHLRTHTGEKPYKCKICSFSTSATSSLRMHMRTHTGEKPYECEFCGYKTAVKSSLTVHTRTHTGEKPYECKICSYKTSIKSSLTGHMRTHSHKNIASTIDRKKTNTLARTVKEEQIDEEVADFGLKESQVVERTNVNSLENMCVLHITVKEEQIDKESDDLGVRVFQGVENTNEDINIDKSVEENIPNHTDEKLYKCEICSYKGSCKSNLKAHTRTHTGEKLTSVCENKKAHALDRTVQEKQIKEETDEIVLRASHAVENIDESRTSDRINEEHTIHQTDEKPFKCDLCHYASYKKDLFEEHLDLHDKNTKIELKMEMD